ncbi:MAG: hypothetical protein ACTTIM_02330 [Campylobacter sp.]
MDRGEVRYYENGENRFYYYDFSAKGKKIWIDKCGDIFQKKRSYFY